MRTGAADRQFVTIEAVGEKCLRVHGFRQVHTVPPIVLDGIVNDPLGALADADQIQHIGQGDADPLGDK